MTPCFKLPIPLVVSRYLLVILGMPEILFCIVPLSDVNVISMHGTYIVFLSNCDVFLSALHSVSTASMYAND